MIDYEIRVDSKSYGCNYDYCYECTGNGDNFYYDDDSNLLYTCDDCVWNDDNWEDGYWREDT